MIFSIIIPTFNSSKTLKKCLDSLFCQTFTDFEVWVIDGVSNDETLEILCKYHSNHNNLQFLSESDNGIYDAMNKGIRLSKGDWLYFLGSDDCLYNNLVLENLYKTISKNKEFKIFYGDTLIKGEAGWAKDGDIYDGEFNLKKVLKKNICHQSIFFHNSIFKEIGNYNQRYKLCADYDFTLRFFAKYKTFYLNSIICIFQGGATSSGMNDIEFKEDFGINIIRYYKFKVYKNAFIDRRNLILEAVRLGDFSFFEKLYFKCIWCFLSIKHRIY